jgi:hypothetical protein
MGQALCKFLDRNPFHRPDSSGLNRVGYSTERGTMIYQRDHNFVEVPLNVFRPKRIEAYEIEGSASELALMTEGLENASRVFSKDKLLSTITEQRDVYKWDFVYLGANQDAIATAAAMGIDAASAITYKPNRAAAANVVSAMSAAVRRSRESGQNVSYTPGELKASLFDVDSDEVKNQRS